MIDIEELERLAKAALWTGDWNASCGTVDCAYPADSKFAGEFDEIAHPVPVGVSDYIEAAQPKAILALIEEVRALREDLQATKLLAHANAEMFKAEKVDGERYRWLRDVDHNGFSLDGPNHMGNFQVSQKVRSGEAHCYHDRFLDAAIDDERTKDQS